MKWARKKEEVPKDTHWVILVFETLIFPDSWGGTESVTKIDYCIPDNDKEMKDWVESHKKDTNFLVVEVIPHKVKLTATIE